MARAQRAARDHGVFLNVPFDTGYRKLFHALVFAVHECGFVARCALEADDGTQVRLEKLYGIIGECLYAVHDISRTSLDSVNRLPRFNMPLELGIFLGAKRFGAARQRRKKALILERTRFLCQKYCSDISGQDARAHENDALAAIRAVRNWLHTVRPKAGLPGWRRMGGRFVAFREKELPAICRRLSLERRDLTFGEYRLLLEQWLEENPPRP
jgi:hypothetical protein